MTTQEALECLININVSFIRGNGKTRFFDAINTAIKALLKQIPKKPIEKPTTSLFTDIRCPDCKTLIARHQKYCKECGQALDWSDKE